MLTCHLLSSKLHSKGTASEALLLLALLAEDSDGLRALPLIGRPLSGSDQLGLDVLSWLCRRLRIKAKLRELLKVAFVEVTHFEIVLQIRRIRGHSPGPCALGLGGRVP